MVLAHGRPPKPIWQSKIAITQTLLILSAVLALLIDPATAAALGLPDKWQAWLGVVAAVVTIVLRVYSTQPIRRGRGDG